MRDSLPEDVDEAPTLPWGAAQGRNDFGHTGYGGPCPPLGSTHHYYFRIYALDVELDLPPGAVRKQVLDEIEAHALDSMALIGRYGRVQTR